MRGLIASGMVALSVHAAAAQDGGLSLIGHLGDGATARVEIVDVERVIVQQGPALVLAELRAVGGDVTLIEVDRFIPAAPLSDFAVADGRVFVALGRDGGLLVLDVSTGTFVELSQRSGFSATAVAVAGRWVYVGAGADGLRLYDAVTPSNPHLTGTRDTPGWVVDLDVANEVLYVADGLVDNGPEFNLYDVRVPWQILWWGFIELGARTTAVSAAGPHAYVSGDFGLAVVDVSSPVAPALLNVLDLGGVGALDVVVSDDRAFVVAQRDVFVVDVTNPATPSVIHTFALEDGLSMSLGPGGDLAMVSDRYVGARIVDISGEPIQVGLYQTTGGFAYEAVFSDNRLLVLDRTLGLRLVDVSAVLDYSGGPSEIGSVPLPEGAAHALGRGTHVYVTDSTDTRPWLTIIDAIDPTSPTVAGTYGPVGPARGIAGRGDYVYVAAGSDGLVVLDVSEAGQPAMAGQISLPGAVVFDVVLDTARNIAFVGASDGLHALDVSDPAMMEPIGFTPVAAVRAVAFVRYALWGFPPLVYLASGHEGLRAADVSDPANPILGEVAWPFTAWARDVASGEGWFGDIGGPVAYLADEDYGARVYEGSASQSFGGFPSADGGMGVGVCRVCLNAYQDAIALAGGDAGVYLFAGPVYGASDPERPTNRHELTIVPNPATASSQIHVSLATSMTGRVELFDTLGRRVALAHSGPIPAGFSSIPVATADLPPGVYVVRMTADAFAASVLMTIVR